MSTKPCKNVFPKCVFFSVQHNLSGAGELLKLFPPFNLAARRSSYKHGSGRMELKHNNKKYDGA